MMKKILKIIGVFALFMLFYLLPVSAATINNGGHISSPLWYLNGTDVTPVINRDVSVTNLTVTGSFTFSGTMGSDLDMNDNDILKIGNATIIDNGGLYLGSDKDASLMFDATDTSLSYSGNLLLKRPSDSATALSLSSGGAATFTGTVSSQQQLTMVNGFGAIATSNNGHLKFVPDGTGKIGLWETSPAYDIEYTRAAPDFTFHNTTASDADQARQSIIRFRGHQSGDEESTLVKIIARHDGSADDQKGEIAFQCNSGTQDDTLTDKMVITNSITTLATQLDLGDNFALRMGSGTDVQRTYSSAQTYNSIIENLGLGDGTRAIILTASGIKNHNAPIFNDPTMMWFSQENVDVSDNHNGWINHDGDGLTLNTDVETGEGTSPATIDNYIMFKPRGVEAVRMTGTLSTVLSGRLQEKQGTDVASASTIALPYDGSIFELTGTTAVTLISNVGWQEGAEITLVSNENVTITNGTATSTTDITIRLAGAGDFAMTADDTLTLMLVSTTASGQMWAEKCRSAN